MRRPLTLLLLALAIVAASPAAAFAADRYVAVGGDDVANPGTLASPFASVQKAVDSAAASGGGNVYVGPGTFTGNVALKNGVSLYGAGASETTLTVTSGRVVTISAIASGETLAGFTITGGSAVSGAGIYCTDSSPVIRDNIIVGNTVLSTSWEDMPEGGGIYCYRGAPTITNNTVSGNATSGQYARGGGISTGYSSAVISGNTVSGNSVDAGSDSGRGGGISCSGGSCTVVGNVVFGNTVSGDYAEGGGIAVDFASAQVTDNVVHDNLVESDSWGRGTGGGIHFSRSSGAVARNSVSGNIARGDYAEGGGIAFDAGWDVYTPTISANVVTGNLADGTGSRGMGGGMSVSDGSPRVVGNIISGNTALGEYGGEGGGLYCSSFWEDHVSTPVITNNVITANLAGGVEGGVGGGVCFSSSPAVVRNNTVAGNRVEGDTPGAGGVSVDDFWGRGRPSIINCILWGNTGTEISGVGITYSCIEGGAAGVGNISSNPLFLDPTAGEYEITAGSPASEVASPTVAPSDDIRGVARPQGAGFDMGAYELAPSIPVAAPVAADDAYVATEDVMLAVTGRGVLANDTVAIERGPLWAGVETPPGNGTLVFSADGSFTYAPYANWFGDDTFEYAMFDTSGAWDAATVTITVQPASDPPVLGSIGPQGGGELTDIAFTATAIDVDTPAAELTFSLGTDAPLGATINAATGEFAWTPAEAQGGTHDIEVIVSDGTHTDSETVSVTVAEVNVAPVLDAIGPQGGDELTEITFTAAASDADLPANVLRFSLGAGAPDGATIDPATGAFTWVPTEAQGPRAYPVTISVSDGEFTVSSPFTITVAEVPTAPVLGAIGDQIAEEHEPLRFTATATDGDLPIQTLTFSLGAGAPAGATIDADHGMFAWTPTEAQGGASYPVTVVVSDGVLEASEDFTITVAEVLTAPQLKSIDDASVEELSLLTFTAEARDSDLPDQELIFSLADGAPAGATVDPATGEFTWTPAEAQGPGTHAITMVVSDGVLTVSRTFTVTVTEVPAAPVLAPIGNRTGKELTPLTFTVAAADPDLPARALTFSLAPGAPGGATIDLATGVFTWTPSEAQGPGSYLVVVVVSDGAFTDSETITVTVAEVAAAKPLAGSSAPVPEVDPATSAAASTGSDPATPAVTAPVAGEADAEESGDDPAADAPADEPAEDERAFPWWIVVLVLALGGLGLFGAIVRRRKRDAGVDTLKG